MILAPSWLPLSQGAHTFGQETIQSGNLGETSVCGGGGKRHVALHCFDQCLRRTASQS